MLAGSGGILVVMVLVAMWMNLGGDSQLLDQSPQSEDLSATPLPSVSFPPLADVVAVREWVRRDGSSVLEFLRLSDPLTELLVDGSECGRVADELEEQVASPTELAAVVSGAPDATLGELVLNDVAAKSDVLRFCKDDLAQAQDYARESAHTQALVVQRLAEYGIED